MNKLNIKFFALTSAIILFSYFFIGSGFHSDDYTAFDQANKKTFNEYFELSTENLGQNFFGIINFYFFYSLYELISADYEIIFDFLKYFINLFSILFFYLFFRNFFDKFRSILFSIIFILYPAHDSTMYWYMTSAYIFTSALIFLSFHLLINNFNKSGYILLLLSTFTSYSSPPYIFGLSIYFLLTNNIKKFFIVFLIGIIYLFFYLYFGLIENNEVKFDKSLDLLIFIKNFTIQLISSIDSVVGINFFLKIYYSIMKIQMTSVIFFLLLSCLIFYLIFQNKFEYKNNNYGKLIIALIAVYLLSLIMFSLTGRYIQSPFNLGNRVTIYSSLLVVCIIVYFIKNKITFITVLLLILFTSLGISDHWKEWNDQQKIIINNINNNKDLKGLTERDTLVISKNLYSKLGKFSHIEFLSQPWIVSPLFSNSLDSNVNKIVISQHTMIKENKIIDKKYNRSILLKENIYKYDTSDDSLIEINYEDLLKYNNEIEKEVRHWAQLIQDENIKKFIIFLSPRLELYL